MENTIQITPFHLFDKLLQNIASKCWLIWIGHTKIKKTLYFICQMNFWKPSKNFKQFGSDCCLMENTTEITVFLICQAAFHWTLSNYVDRSRFPIPKLKGKHLFLIPNQFLEGFWKFQKSCQLQWYYGKQFGNHGFHLFDNLSLNIAYKSSWNWIEHTKMELKHFLIYSKWIPGSISKISYKLEVTVVLCNILYITLFSICLITFHWTLPKNVDWFGLAISILKENTLFHITNGFLEAFWKF